MSKQNRVTKNDVKKGELVSTKIKKEMMLEALKKSLGIATYACNSVGISRETHYRWLKEDHEYEAKCKDTKQVAKDFAEQALFKKVSEGDSSCIIFVNKTLNKDRGYSESINSQELNANPLSIHVVLDNSTVLDVDNKTPGISSPAI